MSPEFSLLTRYHGQCFLCINSLSPHGLLEVVPVSTPILQMGRLRFKGVKPLTWGYSPFASRARAPVNHTYCLCELLLMPQHTARPSHYRLVPGPLQPIITSMCTTKKTENGACWVVMLVPSGTAVGLNDWV